MTTTVPRAGDAAVNAARLRLTHGRQDPGLITVISITPTTWLDDCLGLPSGMTCRSTATPGYVIELEREGQHHLFHTDQEGKQARLAWSPIDPLRDAFLQWQYSDDQGCKMALIGTEQMQYGACGEAMLAASSRASMWPNVEGQSQASYMKQTYAPFTANTLRGTLVFSGTGTVVASEAEQRAIAEWAFDRFAEANLGYLSADYGLMLFWHEETSSFCGGLWVYQTGLAVAWNCGGTASLGVGFLSAAHMQQFFKWLDSGQRWKINPTDQVEGAPPKTTLQLPYSDPGENATAKDTEDMLQFAHQVYAELARGVLNRTPTEVLGITPTAPSTDTVLLARADGALVLHNLADERERVLLDPGLYDVMSGDTTYLVPLGWPVRLSPDGHWLLVPTPKDGTWLVSLDGQTRRQVNKERLQATWGPDSRQIAFLREKGPTPQEQDHEVYTQAVVGDMLGAAHRLARLAGEIHSSAWSPGCADASQNTMADCGRGIAVFARAQDSSSDDYTAWLIDATSGQARELGHFVPPPIGGIVFPTWSPTGDEIETMGWPGSGAIAFPITGGGPRPLVSGCSGPCQAPRSGKLQAAISPVPQSDLSRLTITRADSGASVTFDTTYEQLEAVQWTSDGRRVLVKSYTGGGYTLWAVDPAVGQPELVADKITFLGTLDALRQRSTEIGARRVALRTLPAAGDPSTWVTRTLPGLGVHLRIPEQWRFDVQGSGITQTVTLENFEFVRADGSAALGNDQIQITLGRGFTPPVADFTQWLSQTVEMEQFQVTAEAMTVGGCPAARVRPIISPVGEQVHVPLVETELVITRRPLLSSQANVFDQILKSLEFINSVK